MNVRPMSSQPRIVITGLGLTAPNGNSLTEFRANLLAGKARPLLPFRIGTALCRQLLPWR